MGRMRAAPASCTAAISVPPRRRSRLMKSTITRLSLTTTPDRATMPIIDSIVTSSFIAMCPPTAPTNPRGMALMMMSGCT